MLEMHDGAPVGTGTRSRRRPLRQRLPTLEVPDQQEAPNPSAESDRALALVAHADERYQKLQIRLNRIENALRRLVRANRDAVRGTDRTVQALLSRIEALVDSVETVAARQERAIRAAEARHRADLIEFARRAGRAVGAATATLHRDFASSAEEIRKDLHQLYFDLTSTAERIAGHEHPPAAVTMLPELEIALRESAQRQEAQLARHLSTILEAIPRHGDASASPPATRGEASENPSAIPISKGVPSAGPPRHPRAQRVDEIEDGLARVANELANLNE
jgi:predicted metal-dependent hydrolase